jgi:hypothetical protein
MSVSDEEFVRVITDLYKFHPMPPSNTCGYDSFVRYVTGEYELILRKFRRGWTCYVRYNDAFYIPLPFDIVNTETVAEIVLWFTKGEESEQQRRRRLEKERAAGIIERGCDEEDDE